MSQSASSTERVGGNGPSLELRSRRPPTGATERPILFVHGAYVGAWCWDEHVLAHAATRGHPAYALSLRGHGESDGALHSAGLDDYVADLERAVASLDDPILVGHSMGGAVLQRYLGAHTPPAAVFVASCPPQGMAGATMRFAMRNPITSWQLSLFQNLGPQFGSPRAMKRALFSDDIDSDRLGRYFDLSQRESQRALTELASGGVGRPNGDSRPPVLVVGAGDDAIIPRRAVKQTARAYDAEAVVVSDVAHATMLDTGWQRVTDTVLDWLCDTT